MLALSNSENQATKVPKYGWDAHVSNAEHNHFALPFPYLQEIKLITFYQAQYFTEKRNCSDWHKFLAIVH